LTKIKTLRSQIDTLRSEIAEVRRRSAALSAAMVRISASLDMDTVLNEIVDGARELTAARYGAITTIDERGQLQDFITSGFTAEELQELMNWADGQRLFEHLRDQDQPLRLADFSRWIHSLGFSPVSIPVNTLQSTPVCHRGQYLGTFYLGNKDGGGEFTDDDEAILVLFACQAGAAIANARAHRVEQRVRTNLEGLIETSPVGVAVFDAVSAMPKSFNRAARRIVARLFVPGKPPEHLFEVLCFRFVDGREIALSERPFRSVLRDFKTLRAEQIEMFVPGGQRITVLVNATPIRGKDNTTNTVIITLQDLAPLLEAERTRTEFLSMVSHELRAPLTSIKGSTATALGLPKNLDPAEMRQFMRIIDRQADRMYMLIGDLLDAGRIDTGTLSVSPEPMHVKSLVDQARNIFLRSGGVHALVIDLPEGLPWVMADELRIVQVLNNLLTNAAQHSAEASPIRIDAAHDGPYVAISVSDEGRGVPIDALPRLFSKRAGVGTGRTSRLYGNGLGLAICKGLVEAHGGRIRAESEGLRRGTRITFTLPAVADVGEVTSIVGLSHLHVSGHQLEKSRILVVDDDPETLRYARDALTRAGYAPIVSGDPENLPELLRTKQPHLVLLDLVLPETDGIELLERIPEITERPVIFISGYGRDDTIAKALKAGACDYIVKPFSPTELTARVHAALRQRAMPTSFRLGELCIDYGRCQVTFAGTVLELTATEYNLLRVLSRNAGRVVTHDSLLDRVWGDKYENGRHVVRTYVKRLRQKLGDDPTNPTYIFTKVRFGYYMPEPGNTPAMLPAP